MSEELKNELIKLIKKVFEYIDSIKLVYYHDSEPKIKTSSYGYQLSYEDKIDYFITFYQNCDEFFENLDLNDFNKLFIKDYPFYKNYIKTRSEGRSFSPKEILKSLIVSLFAKRKNHPNFELFLQEELNSLSYIFEKKKTLTRQYYLIINLDYVEGLDTFILQENVMLKRLTD